MEKVKFRKRTRRYPSWREEAYFNVSGEKSPPHLLQLNHIAEVNCFRNKRTTFVFKPGCYWSFLCCTAEESIFLSRKNNKIKLTPSDIIIHTPNDPEKSSGGLLLEQVPSSPCTRYYIGVERNAYMEQMFHLDDQLIIHVDDPERVFACMEEILSFPKEEKEITKEELSVLLFRFLTLITSPKKSSAKPVHSNSQLLEQVMHYPQNYPTLRSLEDLFQVSRETLRKVFQEETSMSPMEFVVNCRLKNSCWMLSYSSLSIREIAELNGYKNPAFYSAAFKKHFGLSPVAYRKGGLFKKIPQRSKKK